MGNALDRLWGNFKLVTSTWLAVFSHGLLLGCETQTIGEETVVPGPLQFFCREYDVSNGKCIGQIWGNFRLVPVTWVAVFSLGLLLGDET